ncbi:uncharacterized protein TRAVEDRAFT_45738 [Trametes versicolor FP-101664 SS1]|uniref:uncharacterized protein n=1 Tax=Trametes versicolor (strain FP-101664) TaxID=717944 RepID=UPI0004622A6C|nr:uncharacterized protein TRAVEDRAFT_45738 [Trametes versicolor FP-101664 SS1]EIW60493.1 hypothetical protein TRAVEDRAFT_45738 [Trametes versicolor FP-101664 SS1]
MSVKFQRDLEVGTSATSTVAMHARPLPGTSMRHRRTHKSQPSWFAKAAILDRSELGTRPSPAVGYAILACSVLFLLVGSYAVFFSAFFPETGVWPLDVLARDTHYKYLAIMLIPAGTGFVIANWVGWQYYRNS